MYVPRALAPTLGRALEQFPSVLVTGPRQSGKTTFLLEEFGQGARYLSLDDPLERGFAATDPNGFLDRFPAARVILDEIQYAPDLLPYLKIRIDRDRRRAGRWLLTGSQQFQLMANVSESLAGRIALLELLPFSLLELPESGDRPLAAAIWNGFYPEPALEPAKRDLWISSYIQTYVERDVRQLLNVQDLRTFEMVLGLCAARHGQELNMADLARSAGISQPTVKTWISLLEAAYIVRLLPPYFESFGKRIVKSPKLYFLDPALVSALTRQPGGEAALAGAMGGALFEGLVVAEAHKVFGLRGKRPDLFFWRSPGGLEVDLVLALPGGLVPVEVKLTATPTLRHAEVLDRFKALAGERAGDGPAGVQRPGADGAPRRQPGIALAAVPGLAPGGAGPRVASPRRRSHRRSALRGRGARGCGGPRPKATGTERSPPKSEVEWVSGAGSTESAARPREASRRDATIPAPRTRAAVSPGSGRGDGPVPSPPGALLHATLQASSAWVQ